MHINIDDMDMPVSVGVIVVDETIMVKMNLTGLIDYSANIRELEKNLSKTNLSLE